MTKRVMGLLTAALMASSCAGTPREFKPQIVATNPELSADMPAETVVLQCDALVRAGHRTAFRSRTGANAAAAAGTAAGVGATGMAVGAAVAGFAGLGIATLAVAAMPVVGVLAGYGISRRRCTQAERVIQTAMSDCLKEHGYAVSTWDRVKRERKPD